MKTRTEGGEQPENGRDTRYASTASLFFNFQARPFPLARGDVLLDKLLKWHSCKDTAQCNLEQLDIDYCNTVFDRLWGGPLN